VKTALSLLIAAPLVVIAAHLTSLGATMERVAVNGAACAMQMEKMDD
jgi:hypothetical protein